MTYQFQSCLGKTDCTDLYGIMSQELVISEIRIDEAAVRGDPFTDDKF